MRHSILHQSPASAWDELHVMAEKIPNEIVPSHFLDPITYTLMLTPVMLPSGQVVDSKTSTQNLRHTLTLTRFLSVLLHMQNHLTDPFSVSYHPFLFSLSPSHINAYTSGTTIA